MDSHPIFDTEYNTTDLPITMPLPGSHTVPFMPPVTIPRAYAPVASDRAFWNGLDLVQIVRDPRSTHLFVRPTFHVVYVACAMAWHTSLFYILVLVTTLLLYVQIHLTLMFYFQNLTFVLFLMSDPYAFLQYTYCVLSLSFVFRFKLRIQIIVV